MSAPLEPDQQDFFLLKDTEKVVTPDTTFRILLAATIVYLSILGLIAALVTRRFSAVQDWAIGGVLWAAAAFFAVVLVREFQTPTRVDVVSLEAKSLNVQYSTGAEAVYPWSDSSFGVTLLDYSRGQSRFQVGRITLILPDHRRCAAPIELQTSLLAMAKTHQLPVLQRVETFRSAMGGAGNPMVTRIGKPEMTPLWPG